MTTLNLGRLEPHALSLLRVVTGFTFFCHGIQKVFGAFGGMDGHGATVHFTSPLGIAGTLETIGGILIVVGLFTRPVALILCGEMAYVYVRHHGLGVWPISNGGEGAVLCCSILLFLCAAGAGPWSLDRLWGMVRKPENWLSPSIVSSSEDNVPIR
jgi:putative oxidoreductase